MCSSIYWEEAELTFHLFVLASSCAQSRNFDLSPINQFSTIQEFFAYHLTISSVQYLRYRKHHKRRGGMRP